MDELDETAPPGVAGEPGTARRVGRYTLVAELARGGMAELWVARRDGDRELRVLKRLLDRFESHPTAAKRFHREAHLTSLLHHPNIARTVDAGIEGGTFCVVSELVAGKNVASIVEAVRASPASARAATGAAGALPQDLALAITFAILDAVIYAHELADHDGRPLRIVHRDLTPRNVVVAYSGAVKVIDFGVARGNVDGFRTAAGVIVGSLEYVSPEQAMGDPVDARSDLYSITSIAYELLTGRPIIQLGDRLADVVASIVRDVPPHASTVNPAVPRAFDDVLARGLAKRASDRPASARELKAALEGAAASARVGVASAAKLGGWLRALAPDGERWFLELQRAHELALAANDPSESDLSIRTAVQQARIAEPTMLVDRRTSSRGGAIGEATALVERRSSSREAPIEPTELVRHPSGFSRPAPGFDAPAPDVEPTMPAGPRDRSRAQSQLRAPPEGPPPELTKLGAVVLDMPGESVITAPPLRRPAARWGLATLFAASAIGLVVALVVTRRDAAPDTTTAPSSEVRAVRAEPTAGAARAVATVPER
ncbi:serine/threonine protein kinase, partial [Myxococcota bacterium]|nr:serine/threonine protein kinase [Myxococcota bacterium]